MGGMRSPASAAIRSAAHSSMRAAGALRRLVVVDGLADVDRTDPVTAGMQQVLRFGQAVRRNLEFGLDDSPAPGVGRCVADAAEERQAAEETTD